MSDTITGVGRNCTVGDVFRAAMHLRHKTSRVGQVSTFHIPAIGLTIFLQPFFLQPSYLAQNNAPA